MDDLPVLRPRTPTGPMGFLNYPPEILNKIYQEVLIDDTQVLTFLCSPDPVFRFLTLKRLVNSHLVRAYDRLQWEQLYDARYYATSRGLSAQFLRVCKKTWFEATPVLYGNLMIAMRWTPRQPDPCLGRFFKSNTPFVFAWAKFVYPRSESSKS